MLTSPIPTGEDVRAHLGESQAMLRAIYDNLGNLAALAAQLSPVEDLEDFRTKIQAIYDDLEVLVIAAMIMQNTTAVGINLLTSASIAEARTHLMIGSAASQNTEFFVTAEALTDLQAELDALEAAIPGQITTALSTYATTTALNTAITTVTNLVNAAQTDLDILEATVTEHTTLLTSHTSSLTTLLTQLNAQNTVINNLITEIGDVSDLETVVHAADTYEPKASFTANGRTFVGSANYAAMAVLLGLGTANTPVFAGVTLGGGLTFTKLTISNTVPVLEDLQDGELRMVY